MRTGIAYCDERDLDLLVAVHAGSAGPGAARAGRTDAAVQLAGEHAAASARSTVSRTPALLTTATAAVRRGEPESTAQLAELQRLARRTAEPLRLLPVSLLLAEAAWTAGRTADIVALTDDVWAAYAASWEPWILAELAWWRRLGGADDERRSIFPSRSP